MPGYRYLKKVPEEELEVEYIYPTNEETDMTNIKRYAISSVITFVATFVLVFFTAVGADDFVISKASLYALIGSAVMVATRAVAKVIIELATSLLSKPK